MTTGDSSLPQLRAEIDAALARTLSGPAPLAPRLIEAMRYAVLAGGKRIRPLLVLATAECLGAGRVDALPAACAVELIHAYSLIHDDLPAMDDDDLRRGRPTVHVAFDEATAILAGDALQALAFEVIASADLPAERRLAMTACLARAVGADGMVGGQALDMAATGRALTLDELETLHRGKTGALLTAAVTLGALTTDAPAPVRHALSRYGDAIGLAFQIVDDLLDVTETTAAQGKRAGADARLGKNTFPALLGIDASRARARSLYEEAVSALTAAGIHRGLLHTLAQQIVERRT